MGDFTYIPTAEGWLFLAVVIDLFSRKVVGWSMQPDMRRNVIIDALEMAWLGRKPGKLSGLIFHSDRGSQYASEDYNKVLRSSVLLPMAIFFTSSIYAPGTPRSLRPFKIN